MAFAANAGAALALFPAQTAQECIASGRLTASLFENVCEILNVCGQLFNRVPSQHHTLNGAYQTPSGLPAEASAVVAAPTHRLDVAVGITGYGGGQISLLHKDPPRT